jgi:glutathione S-transferase
MQPILYSSLNCPHSAKTAFFLAEKGINFRRIEVSLAQQIQKTPDYLAINPRGTVPAYEDEHGIIGDSLTIMRHVDRIGDSPRLFPDVPDRLQAVLHWIERANIDFWDVSHHLYWQLIESPAHGTDWQEVSRLKSKGVALLRELEDSLQDREYVCGAFSAADVALLPWVYTFRRYDLPEVGQFPRVVAWRDALATRRTFQDNRNQAGLPLAEFLIEHENTRIQKADA